MFSNFRKEAIGSFGMFSEEGPKEGTLQNRRNRSSFEGIRDPLARINALRGSLNRSSSNSALPSRFNTVVDSLNQGRLSEQNSTQPKEEINPQSSLREEHHIDPKHGIDASNLISVTQNYQQNGLVRFEDLPASVASREQVGLVNEFYVPPELETPQVAALAEDRESSTRAPSSSRPKPKMLRRGDGMRRIVDQTKKYPTELAEVNHATGRVALVSELGYFIPDQKGNEDSIIAKKTIINKIKNSSPEIVTFPLQTHSNEIGLPVAHGVSLPSELTISCNLLAFPTLSGPAEAIESHLMSVFGFNESGSSDFGASSIIDENLKSFPQSLWIEMKKKSGSDISTFVRACDASVRSHLDIRRLDFLSSMFYDSEGMGLSSNDSMNNVARFTDGHHGFSNEGSVLDPLQYHTIVKQIEQTAE